MPGASSAGSDRFNSAQPRTEAEQQALEENELLGALAFSLAEQQAQAEQGRAAQPSPGTAQGEPAALVEARAALKSQQIEAERAVAAATQQAVQMEAERAAAIAAAAEAMRQRKEAETQLAAQQAQLQQLQHQQQFQQTLGRNSGMPGAPAAQQAGGVQPGVVPGQNGGQPGGSPCMISNLDAGSL
jgi:hypothetical protein